MVFTSAPVVCPVCDRDDFTVRHGQNRSGTLRYRCRACGKAFTPEPVVRGLTPDKEEAILGALQERVSLRGAARLFGVGRNTVTALVEKKRVNFLR